MAKQQWFRLYAEFATDPKVQSMSETLQRRYVMLLCFQCNDDLVSLTEDELAFALRVTPEELAETKAAFIQKGFIDDDWNLLNWHKRQFKSDTSTDRVKKFRDKKKQPLQKQERNVSETPPETDTETDKKGAKAPTVWDVGVGLGIERGVLGKAIKQHGEEIVAGALVKVQGKRAADPKTYFLGCLPKPEPKSTMQKPGSYTS